MAKTKKPKTKVVVTRGKRKSAIARATVKKGKGIVRINSVNLNSIEDSYIKGIINECLAVPEAKMLSDLNISLKVMGGGRIGQTQAACTAIARGLVEYSNDEQLKIKFAETNRFFLVEDFRRIEPKKFGGRKARARRQKSYR